jgi:hypothetical protein
VTGIGNDVTLCVWEQFQKALFSSAILLAKAFIAGLATSGNREP